MATIPPPSPSSKRWIPITPRCSLSSSKPNQHNHFPLPLLVAGGACGKLEGGRLTI
jgi:hypothetical protein